MLNKVIHISLFLLFVFKSADCQYANLKFENYSTMEGLSSSTCLELFQDKDGFMWFGTIDGLNRYDGYDFKVYRPALNGSNSISNNRIHSIVQDGNGNLWIGTSNGLNVLDKNTNKFYRIDLKKPRPIPGVGETINTLLFDEVYNEIWVATKDGLTKLSLEGLDFEALEKLKIHQYSHESSSIDNNNVTNILKDQQGQLWIGTSGKYLNRYERENDSFVRVLIDIPDSYELDHLPKAILIDHDGDFWIGNDLSRLILWDKKNNIFKQISEVGQNIPIFHIYQDSKGIIWIATDGYGIYFYEKGKGLTQHLVHNPNDPSSLPNNQPSKILEDKNGTFWIASYNKGVSKLVLSKSSFGHYFYQQGTKNSLSARIAQSVMVDSKNRIWVGTDGGGLNLFHENTNSFEHFRTNPHDPFSISSDKITYLLESHDGNIWVCTWDGGLSKFNPKEKKATRYKHDYLNPLTIGQNTVWCAVEDKLRRLWLGTQTAGLNLFDPHSQNFYKFLNKPGDTSSIISNFVFSIFIDSHNRLLIGTSLGLNVVDLDQLDKYVPDNLVFQEIRETNIQGNRINYINEDHSGNIWLGTDLGLHQLNSNLKLIKSFSTTEGLPNNLILGIKEDNNGNFWITTKSGLSRLDPQKQVFKNLNIHDGIQGMEFQSKSIAKTLDGRILIGGINGFNIFDPSDIQTESDHINTFITGFKLFNKSINVGDTVNKRVLLKESISNTRDLKLKYNEGYIAFEFVALYFENPGRVRYAYRMKGLDEDFIFSGSNKIANYSNLPPGDYVFEVKASVDDMWDNISASSIQIKVYPPPWKTWWAYVLYVLFFMVVFWLSIRYYTKIVRDEKEHELDQMKLSFFINVSHEFRTPLTLILNPIEKILSAYNDPEEVKNSALTIQRSARRLLNLMNQLLDFRKMDLGKSPLEPIKGDIVKFSRDIFYLFADLAKVKQIDFSFACTTNSIQATFDPDKVEKIITNLLSNAIKFTEQGGTVTLKISSLILTKKSKWNQIFKKQNAEEYVEIKVEDTGIGLKQEQLKEVFSRFFHVDNTKTGTGIGLNFTKGLVELHGGEILVESEYGKGSSFIVRLPVQVKVRPNLIQEGTLHLGQYNYNSSSIKATEYEVAILLSDKNISDEMDYHESSNDSKRPLVLIVEDNRELRVHLKNELKQKFKVKEAANGVEGLEKVMKFYPDIIISDVMMPEMDGFELCRRVKTELEFCHIPFVLLTARSLEEDRIEGYNTGADEYLPKPFNVNVLKARINNLLESRKRLREKFASGMVPYNEITSNNLDEVFLEKATKFILENASDPDFGLEDLLREIGISRSQFYRKINSLTGQNPSNFIRTIRLKYASELLVQQQYSIKEVAYMSGFNSSAYFSKTFRELFGQTPNEYIEGKR